MTYMAQIKISQISKDFNLKTKDVADVFKEIGFEKKNSGAVVEAEEFELFLVHIKSLFRMKESVDILLILKGKRFLLFF